MEYVKDFDAWNTKKKIIDQKETSDHVFFAEREIWWGSLGLNIGYEQDGKNENFERPLLLIKKFNRDIVLAVPLTSVAKNNKFHHKLKSSGSFVILSQMRLISTKRLLRRVEKITDSEFEEIISKIKSLFP
ncbi:MAG: type II toxin-antitoxin system PemK/MazF family toxin [Candidatus Nomurabacteria bacterium]|nr:type II toxin-antitoxin system PemK/MazF family toxin [Candidatus Nomurabacteria bacterium]